MAQLTLSGDHGAKLRQFGASPGDHVVLEIMASVKSQTADGYDLSVVDVRVLDKPKNFKDAAKRSYVALRMEHSVG